MLFNKKNKKGFYGRFLDLQFEKYYRSFYLPKARNGSEGAKKWDFGEKW